MAKDLVFAVFCQQGEALDCFDNEAGRLQAFLNAVKNTEIRHEQVIDNITFIVTLEDFSVYASRGGELGDLSEANIYDRVVFVGWAEGNEHIFAGSSTSPTDMKVFNTFLQKIFSTEIDGFPYHPFDLDNDEVAVDSTWIIFRVPDGCNVKDLELKDLIGPGSGLP